MDPSHKEKIDRINEYAKLIYDQTGKAVRPYRADGYVNMMNKYGTEKDSTEHYQFTAEPEVPDETLSETYEGNGLFAKIIDTPAEEAVKHGFKLEGVSDEKVIDFYESALDELEWEESAMTALKWMRLYGGSIAVMLIDDGRGLEEPLDWRAIRSIDDIRVFDRSVVTPDYASMYKYDPHDPFSSRGSRLGMPEYYRVDSLHGSFVVHDSRCLVFQNGILPERCTNINYQMWGMPEYTRIYRAIRDSEIAHGSAAKMLDRSVQAIYKMKDLSSLLSTEDGENLVLKRLQVIDMARGLLNSIALDSEGEEYDFRSFSYSGVSEVINTTCEYLSAVTSIPQTILFGRAPAGMNATGHSDFENYYNFVERIQKRVLKKNLRYLLSVIFHAGKHTGEVSSIPKISVEFDPLWSLSETEKVALDIQKAQLQMTKAQTAQVYVSLEILKPNEIRDKLASEDDFTIDTAINATNILQDYRDALNGLEEKLKQAEEQAQQPAMPGMPGMGGIPGMGGMPVGGEEQPDGQPMDQNGNQSEQPDILGQEMQGQADAVTDSNGSVGILVVKDGHVLCGRRKEASGLGLICGPGGHIEDGETPREAAVRETKEEFGIDVVEMFPIGYGKTELDTGLTPILYLCTEYSGNIDCNDGEMYAPSFHDLDELMKMKKELFPPFANSLDVLKMVMDESYFVKDREIGYKEVNNIQSLRKFIMQFNK